jgi:hypothetical protein
MSPRPPETLAVRRRPSEAGSAYLIALLALVVLTIIGLSLSLVTQTEMQIGANERTIERTFYAADSGIALATANTLVAHTPAWSRVYKLPDPSPSGFAFTQEVDVSPFFPISSGPCNLCDIANKGQYGAHVYEKANHAVTSTAVRRLPGNDQVSLGERSVTAMVEFQPWELPPDSERAVVDPSQLGPLTF